METNTKRIYTSRITQVGAQLADTRTLLSQWDQNRTVEENLKHFQSQNIFGKASRVRVSRILKVFRERYLTDETVTDALVTLAKGGASSRVLNPILYFHAAQSDRLLHDIVTEYLIDVKKTGTADVDGGAVRKVVQRWSDEGKTSALWAESTLERIAVGLLATLRDFGVLTGMVNKQIAPLYLPIESFAYVAHYLKVKQPSGERLINDPEWRLFFLAPQAVERLFVEAQQHRLLEYHAAGRVIRVSFPVESLEEYANVILRAASRTA